MSEPLRVANCSGYLGDRPQAAAEMLDGGPIDVLTGDYLAELTMLILDKQRRRSGGGYARTFLSLMEQVLGRCLDRGVKVVVNAGGLNPAGLAADLSVLAEKLGLSARIAYVDGDDLLPRLDELQAAGIDLAHPDTGTPLSRAPAPPATANAYLGAWGIVAALDSGADVVITPRVTDASLVVGPAAWRFGWAPEDWNELASAVVVGHILECGAQATGGNYSFLDELPDRRLPGFPIAEIAADGSAVITKHPHTGGLVSVGTVTAQLLYELGAPRYANPDVVARFDTIALADAGHDRVTVARVRGEPAPEHHKVCITYDGGYRNAVTFLLTGLDIETKAVLVTEQLFDTLGGREGFGDVDVRLVRGDRPDARDNAEATARLTVTVKSRDKERVGRAFSGAAASLGLSSYPGFYLSAPPGDAQAMGVYWPALVPSERVRERVVTAEGSVVELGDPVAGKRAPVPEDVEAPGGAVPWLGPTRPAPLGALVGARSGDKGGNANLGVWARSADAHGWLSGYLTVAKLRELVPETATLTVERYELGNLWALNFVIHGILGEGVASSTRPDPQAKSLGEFLRSRTVEIPEVLL